MNWASAGDFFAMGGYAFYVWGSYFVTLVLILVEVMMVRQRRRSVAARLARSAGVDEKGETRRESQA